MRGSRWLASGCALVWGFVFSNLCWAQSISKIDFCNTEAALVLRNPDGPHIHNIIVDVVNSPSCLFQVSLSDPAVNNAITPARVSLWDAYQSFSSSQQQGSSLSSSGSTNTVSKPAGPTALVQEFGGANVTRGTSSSTVQWSPGTMLTNLALNGANYLCLGNQKPKTPPNCISPALLRGLTPLTFKITANTSSGTPSMTGTATATSTNSTASSQQVTVNSKGASGPSFAGLTVQYSLPFSSKNESAVKSLTAQASSDSTKVSATQSALEYYKKEILGAHGMELALGTCTAYQNWKGKAEPLLNATLPTITNKITNPNDKSQAAQAAVDLQVEIERQYGILLKDMTDDPTCQAALYSAQSFYATILEAETAEYFLTTQTSSAKPEIAFEYDLQTPQDKPSYSTVKATGSWQFGKKAPNPAALKTFANSQTALLSSTKTGNPAVSGNQLGHAAKPLAQDTTPPFSLTLTGTVDIYNSEPPASVPSGSHLRDIQAGAEFAWLFTPFRKGSTFGNLLGSVTAAAAYSYEDQTSPALLTGPALSDFTNLPSSTTIAYAQRGVIHLGQIRFGLGTGKNLTYPLAFTYSNRTEFITHPTWGLQFGISYNLTSLFNSGQTSSTGK